MKKIWLGIQIGLLCIFLSGCNDDDDLETKSVTGIYEAFIIEAGVTQTRIWQLTQNLQDVLIVDTSTGMHAVGTLSGQDLSVLPQTVQIENESFIIAMNLRFDSELQSFTGTQTSTIQNFSFTQSVTGHKT